jgi:hypothetical protein
VTVANVPFLKPVFQSLLKAARPALSWRWTPCMVSFQAFCTFGLEPTMTLPFEL